ncbi:hypothetical protein FA048_02800 [Pedobacter polaris]|uniref:YXWGXW repeat-containing protein n=1 Tax=Pedobacter polaris TaxID=2571273 RepID=A0A4U1CUU0_9SPHI|nr:DUF6600 domain-containing protein [Pedobacter polaris]TKC12563.1 hypothetical protein FA048_02800 [Pedobacter polaris]
MKNMIKLPAMLVGLMLLFAGTAQTAKAQQEDVSLQSFYDELSPYGTWIQDPQYGYVWRPDVDQEEFRPYYTNGRWAMTEYGNTWVSNYDWGWAPFHYGRWIYNRYNNWVWLPDTVWGPAWVSWRSGGGHYGWAPLGPSITIGINIGRGGYRVPDMCWNFIPYNNIYYNSYPRYNYGRNRVYIQNTVIINNTYVRNNRTYYTGPRAEDVRRATNQNVTVYNVNRSSRPGASRIDNNTVNIYNPRPSRGSVNNNNAAPRSAVQGSINRGPVAGRDGSVSANRTDRGNTNGNVNQGSRNGFDNRNNGNVNQGDRNGIDRGSNGNVSTRPSRGEATGVERDNNNRSATPNANRDGVSQRPSVFDRRGETNNQPQRVERSPSSESQPQRVERNREMPQQQQAQPQQRVERQREMPQQRMERPQPVQQAPQQRVERPQPVQQAQPQQQRVERSQSAPPQRSSGGSESSRGGGGRPGRG